MCMALLGVYDDPSTAYLILPKGTVSIEQAVEEEQVQDALDNHFDRKPSVNKPAARPKTAEKMPPLPPQANKVMRVFQIPPSANGYVEMAVVYEISDAVNVQFQFALDEVTQAVFQKIFTAFWKDMWRTGSHDGHWNRYPHGGGLENQGAMCESHTTPPEANTYNQPIVVHNYIATLMDANRNDDVAIYTMMWWRTNSTQIFIWPFIVSRDKRHISSDDVRNVLSESELTQRVISRLDEWKLIKYDGKFKYNAWCLEQKFPEIYKPGHIFGAVC